MRPGPRSKALVSAWLDLLPQAQRDVALDLRHAAFEAEPCLEEAVRWGQLVLAWQGVPLMSIAPHRGHVSLQLFYGHLLPQDMAPLEGNGKAPRFYKCRLNQPVDTVQVQRLVAAVMSRAPAAGDDRQGHVAGNARPGA